MERGSRFTFPSRAAARASGGDANEGDLEVALLMQQLKARRESTRTEEEIRELFHELKCFSFPADEAVDDVVILRKTVELVKRLKDGTHTTNDHKRPASHSLARRGSRKIHKTRSDQSRRSDHSESPHKSKLNPTPELEPIKKRRTLLGIESSAESSSVGNSDTDDSVTPGRRRSPPGPSSRAREASPSRSPVLGSMARSAPSGSLSPRLGGTCNSPLCVGNTSPFLNMRTLGRVSPCNLGLSISSSGLSGSPSSRGRSLSSSMNNCNMNASSSSSMSSCSCMASSSNGCNSPFPPRLHLSANVNSPRSCSPSRTPCLPPLSPHSPLSPLLPSSLSPRSSTHPLTDSEGKSPKMKPLEIPSSVASTSLSSLSSSSTHSTTISPRECTCCDVCKWRCGTCASSGASTPPSASATSPAPPRRCNACAQDKNSWLKEMPRVLTTTTPTSTTATTSTALATTNGAPKRRGERIWSILRGEAPKEEIIPPGVNVPIMRKLQQYFQNEQAAGSLELSEDENLEILRELPKLPETYFYRSMLQTYILQLPPSTLIRLQTLLQSKLAALRG